MIFSVSGEDIARLDDVQLRLLVAKLCAADLRKHNLPLSSLTAGGNQNAADGGLDVRVDIRSSFFSADFIPRAQAGIQVKVPDMPRGEILKEMKPNGELRPVIVELIKSCGAYIIVSSSGSVADSALKKRVAAMREALNDVENSEKLLTDFYDRDRLANWVNLFPGVALWMNEVLGKPLSGWAGYGNWSALNRSIDEEYITDDTSRLRDGREIGEGSLPVQVGIERIRDILSKNGGTVRLIGLSGLGKTRLAEALFDSRVGANSLDPAEAIYTDIGDNPVPSPHELINKLIKNDASAIVIVDNCTPQTHRRLVETCRQHGSKVRLLTIEYDVGEDDPEGTWVFRLEPASDEITEKLVQKRYPQISSVDIRRISEFSGGNARIALALAKTVGKGASVSDLTDRQLFARLFHQGNTENAELLNVAEVLSLVYSFDGEALDGEDAELPHLAGLCDQTSNLIFRHVHELRMRELVQKRGKWRAVLPHALANKMAKQALGYLHPDNLEKAFWVHAPVRLLKSFSRRLGYLHASEDVQRIVKTWLRETKYLSDIAELSEDKSDIFFNVAPVMPEETLRAFEKAEENGQINKLIDPDRENRAKFAGILRSLAFDPELFDRSAKFLAKFVLAEKQNPDGNSTSSLFLELFRIYLSGTHAKVEQRIDLLSQWLVSGEQQWEELAISALDEMLETWHFSSFSKFEFGARPRDYGWQPAKQADVQHWYETVISKIVEIYGAEHRLRNQISSILANNFRGLWKNAGRDEQLENAVEVILAQGMWIEGWIKVKETIRFEAAEVSVNKRQRLLELEKKLRPSNLLDLSKAYALSRSHELYDLDEEIDKDPEDKHGLRATERKTKDLGLAVSQDAAVFSELLPDLVCGENGGRRWTFGQGLALGWQDDPYLLLASLCSALGNAPSEDRNYQVLRGVLSQLSKTSSESTEKFFDWVEKDGEHIELLPEMLVSTEIGESGSRRLLALARSGEIPAWRFGVLQLGRATRTIRPRNLRKIIHAILRLPDGESVAIEILQMTILGLTSDKEPIPLDLMSCAREVFSGFGFPKTGGSRIDYELARLIDGCGSGVEGQKAINDFCSQFIARLSDHLISAYDYRDVLRSIFKVQPIIAMSNFLEVTDETLFHRIQRFLRISGALEVVDIVDIVKWASSNPERFVAAASCINPFGDKDSEEGTKFSGTAMSVLDACPDKIAILRHYQRQFIPSTWSGDLSYVLERRKAAPMLLMEHSDTDVATWAKRFHAQLDVWISQERERERERSQSRDERFE